MDIDDQKERTEVLKSAEQAASLVLRIAQIPKSAETADFQSLSPALVPIMRLLGTLQELDAQERGIRTYYDGPSYRYDSAEKPILEMKTTIPRKKAPRAKTEIKTDIEKYEKEVVEQTEAIVAKLKAQPKYSSAEFNCINDYDKCVQSRVTKVLCAFALVICIGRRAIPFVKLRD